MQIDAPSKLVSFPVCGGLHHRYERLAALGYKAAGGQNQREPAASAGDK